MHKVYQNTDYPVHAVDKYGKEETFSVDVITVDEHGMMNIGFWNYDMGIWGFHTDTLVDPYEGGKLRKFVWMYKPDYFHV